MPEIRRALETLRKEERQLEEKLAKLRRALAALTGSAVKQVVTPSRKRTVKKVVSSARAMTAAQKKAVSQRMKKYWAAKKKKKKA